MKKTIALFLSLVLMLQPVLASAAFSLPSALKSIQAEAFVGNKAITGNLQLPDNVRSVGDRAFADTDVFALWLPAATTSVGSGVLAGAGTSYAVVENATASLADSAFDGVEILFGKSYSTAQRYAEKNDLGFFELEKLHWHEGFVYYSHGEFLELVTGATEHSGSVTIPQSVDGYPVAMVSGYAFMHQSGLTSISLPDAVEENMPAETSRTDWPAAAISFYSTGIDPVIPPEADPENGGIVMELDVFPSFATLMPGDVYIPVLEELPEGEYLFSSYSTDESIVDIDENGDALAVAPGSVAFTVTAVPVMDGEPTASELGVTAYYGTVQLLVVEPDVTIDLFESTVSMNVGQVYYPRLNIKTPSSIGLPELEAKAADDTIADAYFMDGELMLEAKAEGETTITLTATVPAYGDYEAVTATAEIKLNVAPAAFETTYATLYTYAGLEHDLTVTSELPEDAEITFTTLNDLVSYNKETGRVVIGDQPGESAVTITVAYADGTQESVTVPVYIKPFLSFGEPEHRSDLNAGWEYHYEWENLMPELNYDLWAHDNGLVYTYAEAENEQLSIENELTEGKPVIVFDEDEDEAGNIWVRSIAQYPGAASVTYYATLNTDVLPDTVHVPVVASEPVEIGVQIPEIIARLDKEYYTLFGDEQLHIGYGWDEPHPVQLEKFESSDESIFTVTAYGGLIPHNPGEATLTYTLNCFGVTSTATATVYVHGGSISLSPAEATVHVGEQITLVPVLPEDVNGTHYDFFPADDTIATVNEFGVVTGLRAGSTEILYHTTINDADLWAKSLVHVVDESARLSLNTTSVRLYEGESFQLEAIYADGDAPVSIEWESSYDSAVFVDENGMITPIMQDWAYPDAETITCTATFADGSVETATCQVYAEEQIISMTSEWGHYRLEVGQTQEFYGTVSIAGNYTLSDFDVTYISDNEDVVTVDESGLMTAQGEGTTKVSVVYELDGRCIFRNFSFVHVGTPYPTLDDCALTFTTDHFFVPVPENGEPIRANIGYEFNNPDMWHYYWEELSILNAEPEGSIVLTDDGIEVYGEGTAELFITAVAHDEDIVVPEGFGDTAKLTASVPRLRYDVTSFSGEEKETVLDDEYGLPVVELGDIVTVTIDGIPEHIGHNFTEWDHDYYAFREIARTDRTLTLQAQRAGRQTHLSMDTGLDCNTSFYLEEGLIVAGEEAEFNVGEPSVTLAVGESTEIYPAFPGWDDGVFTAVAAWDEDGKETDASDIIAFGEEFPTITAVAPGRVQLVANVTLRGEKLSMPVYVTVVESDWYFNVWGCEDIMFVGQGYDPCIDVVYTGYHCPTITISFSDPSLMEMNYDYWCLIPLRAGEVTITATIEGDGRTETVTKDVTIIEPSLSFKDGPYMDLLPNERRILTLVNNTGKEIESVEWIATHNNHAVLDIKEDTPTSILVIAGGNYTNDWFFSLITANVTFTDGTTGVVSARIGVQPAHEVWPESEIHEYYFELSPGETAEIPYYLDWNTTTLSFTTENPDVATVSANGIVTAVNPGETQIVVRFGTYSDNVREERVTIVVKDFKAALTPSALTLNVGESAYVAPSIDLGDSGYWVNDQRTGYWSMDDNVACVDHLGLVTAKAPGNTVIVYETFTFYDDHRLIAYCPVTVTGEESGLTLNASEISLRPREEFQLEFTVNGNLESDVTWSSSDPYIITVTDGLVKLRNWDIYDAVQTGSVYATAIIDGVETTAVCKVNFLPAAVSLYNAPNFYTLGVGERALVEYAVTVNDPSTYYIASFESTDENIMTVDENGVMTGISEGVCMVRLNLTDENGTLLCSGAAYVYVNTPLPTPADEGAAIDFEADHYYMTLDEEMGKHRSAFIIDPAELGIYYEFHIESDNEDIVICHGGDHIEAVGEGTTTIRAWFEGFEEYAATATVTVGNPYLTFDKPTDEHGNPIVAAGDLLTVTLHGMPTFGNMDPTTQIAPQFVNINADLNQLREYSRGVDEEGRNTFTFFKMGYDGCDVYIDMLLECGWWNGLEFYVHGEEPDEFHMSQSALVMAIGEEEFIWPEFGWEEYVSVTSSNEDAVTVEITDEGDLLLTSVGLGDAVITAEILTHDDETVTVETKVHSVKAFWRFVHLDHIDESMKVGQRFELYPHIVISGRHYPDVYWESSDPSILAVETFEDEGDWHAVPQSPGVATLTCYATLNGETQEMSKTVTVIEPRVYFADLEPEIRPNQTKFLPLVIVGDTDEKIVENITYYSEDAGLVSVEDGLLEYGEPGAKITCVKPNNSTRIFAVVEFKDGSVATAACRVWPLDNEGVWINAHTDNLDLSTEPWGRDPKTSVLSLWWDTNAAMTRDENNLGTDTAWVEWHIEDEDVARIIGNEDLEYNNAVIIEAVGEGDTSVYATIRVYDADGNEIARDNVERRIHVEEPHFEVRPEHDTYYLDKTHDDHWAYVNWEYDEHHIGAVTAEVFYSDDPSIVFCDQHGNISAENSGETDIHCEVYINGHHAATGTAHVVVTGSNVVFWKDSATLNEGESLQLIAYPQLRSDAEFTLTFTSDNEAVARVNENGLLYAVAPGRAMIACWLETEDGYVDEAQFFVTVTGETPAFALSADMLKLYSGASYTFTNDLSGYDSVSWNIEGHENITFDEETQTVHASHNDEAKTYTAVITCTVVKDGVTYTANCHAALLSTTLRIAKHQFGEGAWHTIHVDDVLGIWELYYITDPSLEVTVDIWTEDESIAVYDADRNAFVGLKVGDTMAHYKVTASNGETHTASAMLRVVEDERDVWPERIDAMHTDHALVVDLSEGERGFPFVTTPEYTGMEMRFFSDNDDILSFSDEPNDGRMFLHDVGRTTVTIEPGEFAPEGIESAQGEVLVLDRNRIVFAPVDEDGNPLYDLTMGQTYQLAFTPVDGGILWEDRDVESIEYSAYWDGIDMLLSETGELQLVSARADRYHADAHVRFKDGFEMGFHYEFYPTVPQNQAHFFFHGSPYSRFVMPVDSYHDNVALVFGDEWIFDFTPATTDASVAEFVFNEDRNVYAIKTYGKAGEATLTGTATLESGETVTAELRVIVRPGEAPDVTMEPSRNLLTIGDEVEFYIGSGNGFTQHPNIDEWVSSDDSVLEQIVDENGPTGRFRAVGIGEATVTAVAHYGGVYRNLTATIYVTDYPVAYLDEPHVDLRPDEKHQLILMENEFSTKEIASVEWSIDDDSIATFTPFEGNRSVSLTGVAKSGDTTLRATVTATDGSASEYTATIHITANDEVWVKPWHEDVWLGLEDWSSDPQRNVVWQSWNHNASHFDEIGEGTDKAWIEWEIEDENIAILDGFYELREGDLNYGQETHAPWNNGVMVKAVSEGDTVIRTHLVLTDKDGNFLAECYDEIPVHVYMPSAEISADRDTYEVRVGRHEWVEWHVEDDGIRGETSRKLYTDDPSIAVFDGYGNIIGVKPGETTMHCEITFGSKTFSASAKVVVIGPEFRFAQNEITVEAGNIFDPGLILNDNGYRFSDPEWYIDNQGVVAMLSDGNMYAKAPGATYVYCEIDVEGIGWMEIRMLVKVTGEAPAYALSSDALTLYQGSTAKLQIVSTVDEELNEETIRWSTSDENLITVDQEGNVTVHTGHSPDREQDAAVFCDAETMSGDPVSMVCLVTVPKPSVRINEYQFHEGAWYTLNIDEGLGIWECYTLYDPSLTVDVSVTVDDEKIIEYRYDNIYNEYYFYALAEGAADVHYTITASNGETYTRSMRILVEQDTTPEAICLDERIGEDHSLAMCLEDGSEEYAIWCEPAYTGTELHFYSSDDSIVGVDKYDLRLHPQNPGHATIFVECPEMPNLNTQFDVSVICEANVRLVAEDGRTTLNPHDSVQLVFETTDGVMWRESDIFDVEYDIHFDDQYVWVDENDVLHSAVDWDADEITIGAVSWFEHDHGVAAEYTFSVDSSQPYFLLSDWEGGINEHMTLAEGSGFHLYLHTNVDYNPETLIYSSSNPEAVDFFGWDEERGDNFHVHAFGTGEAELTVTIPEHDMTATFPVSAIIPDGISKHISVQDGRTVALVGDQFEIYDINDNEDWESASNFDEIITYESSNPEVLDTVAHIKEMNGEEPDGRDWMTLRALAPGQATITMTATYQNYPEYVCTDSVTITVVEPPVYFTERNVDLRPGQTRFIPLVIVNDTGEKIVENITFRAENPDFVSVEDGLLEFGSPAAKITSLNPDGSTRVTAVVEFKDGSVATAVCKVHPIPNHEVWLDVYGDHLNLSTEPWGAHPMTDVMRLGWDTNAALTTDPNNPGADTAWVEWHIDNENIARIVGYEDQEQNNNPIIEPVNSGDTVIRMVVCLYDADGNEITRRDYERWIFVHDTHFEITPEQDVYHLDKHGRDWQYVNWWHNAQGVGPVTAEVFYSDNEDVVICDQHGNIKAVNSGETTIRCDIYVNDMFAASSEARVIVEGSNIRFSQDGATLNEGESMQLIVHPETYGDAKVEGIEFGSDNEAVARVTNDGLLYAVAPGRAVVSCWLCTSKGDAWADFVVNVTGETPAFTLSESAIELRPGESYTFTDDLSGYDSVSWYIDNNFYCIDFDEETQTVTATHNDGPETKTDVIVCEAVKDGVTYTAACHVSVPMTTIRIAKHQFGEGAWYTIKTGDSLHIWERYFVAGSGIDVAFEMFTEDPEIAYFDAERNAFIGNKVGDTMAYYRVMGSNGETHTASAMLRVVEDERDVWPERIDAMHTDHALVVNLRDGEHGFPFVTTPEYTGMEMYFRSDNEDILGFSGEQNDGRMYLRNPGRTMVTIEPGEFAPEGIEGTQGEVLVLDPERIMFAPLDEDGNPLYDLTMGETYQLSFTPVDGGILWEEDDVESITYESYWGDSERHMLISETGELSLFSSWNDFYYVNALVSFKDGTEMGFYYEFYPTVPQNQAHFVFHGDPYARLVLPVDSYHDNTALVFGNEWIHDFTPATTDAEIAEFVFNDYWNAYTVQTYGKTGEATLTGTATLESGETVTAELQVVVRPGEVPDVTMNPSMQLLTLGDEVEFYIGSGNGFTIAPNIDEWVSSDDSVLEQIVDENGPTGRFRAVGIGSATVTAMAHYGGVYRNLTCTVYVADYPAAYIEESFICLRPDAQHEFVVHVNEHSTKDVASVQWRIDDDSIASFAPVEDSYNVVLTGLAQSGDTTLYATITDSNGSVTEFPISIHITHNDEIWVDPWHEEIRLSTEPYGSDPYSRVVWQHWSHNASFFDEDSKGSDKAWIEWSIDDENIAVFDGFFDRNGEEEGTDYAPWNNGPMVKAVSEGNTFIRTHLVLTDKDGNFLAECRDEIPVYVSASHLSIYPYRDTYEVDIGRREWVGWHVDGENTRSETGSRLYTDDPSIAVFDIYGNIVGMAPGETTMHYDVDFGSETLSAAAEVIVHGPEFRFAQSEITVEAGEIFDPGLILNAPGHAIDGPFWRSDNADVVSTLSDGMMYAKAPGATNIYCTIDTESVGGMEIRMLVKVTGEAPAYALSSDALTLYQGSTAKLQIVSTVDEALNEETIRWSTSDENLITVDQEGNVTVHNGNEPEDDQYAAVFCDAETMSGDPVSMVCIVTVPKPSVRINEYQFHEGAWYTTDIGEGIGMWESYTLYDPSLTVDVSISVDDESIAECMYDPIYDHHYFYAHSDGVTDAYYTITASNGETYTRSARLMVEQDTTPESVCIDEMVGEDNSIALCLEDGDLYVHVWCEPAYTGTELRFSSSDDSIVTVDETNSVLHPQNPGHATIFVECPEMPHLNTQFDVSVICEENVRLVAEDGRTTLSPNDSVQLVFETTDGVMWRESDIFDVEYDVYYDDNIVWVDENGVLHTRMNHGEGEITIRGVTFFKEHQGVATEYRFSVDENAPYFYLSAWEDGNGDHITLAEGSGFHMYLNTNVEYNPETLIISSSNPEAIDFNGWDEERDDNFHVHAFGSGEAELTVTIPEHDLTATFPVRSFVPTEIDMGMGIEHGSTVIYVGDELELYTFFNDEDLEHCSNMDDRHGYSFDNPAIADTIENIKLANDEDPEVHDWMTLRALAPGQVTVTSTATYENYPHLVDVDTMTITVLPAPEADPYFFLSAWDDGQGDHYTLAPGSGIVLTFNTNQSYDLGTLEVSSSDDDIAFTVVDENGLMVVGSSEGDATISATIPECDMTATFMIHVVSPANVSKHISVENGRIFATTGDEIEIYDVKDNEDWEKFANFDEIVTYESSNPAVIDTIANIKEANDEDPEGHDWMTLRALTPGTATITMTTTFRNHPEYSCTDSVIMTVLPADENEPYFFLSAWDNGQGDHYSLAPGSGIFLTLNTNQTYDYGTLEVSTSEDNIVDIDLSGNGLLLIGRSEGEVTITVTIPECGLTATFPVSVVVPTGISKHINVQNDHTIALIGDEFEIYCDDDNEDFDPFCNFDEVSTFESDNPEVLDTLANIKLANGDSPNNSDWYVLRALSRGQATITMTATYRNYPQYTCTDTVTISVYDEDSKIAILTGTDHLVEEEYLAARSLISTYGRDIVLHETYPDDFMGEMDTTIAQLEAFAEDPSVKAIIACQAVPGVGTAFAQIAETCAENERDIPLMIMGVPQEDPDVAHEVADIILSSNEPAQADTIAETLARWDIDTFVHYSFPRHLAINAIAQRKDRLANHCEELGIELVEITIPDPATDGLEAARTFVTNDVALQVSNYAGKKVAFFATVCGVQSTLQSAVLANENAYYPQPCCPSPYHGFGESLQLDLPMENPQDALRQIASALDAHGAAGRFSTWELPVNMAIIEAAGAYAMAYAQGEITERCSAERLSVLFASLFPNATISQHEDYDDFFLILLSPVYFDN
ncbi:MAG: Ig-like domain-containing protein [Clostridia bacterium]|nr:Ig-like domain-containing protein [Clostridia bacterium]